MKKYSREELMDSAFIAYGHHVLRGDETGTRDERFLTRLRRRCCKVNSDDVRKRTKLYLLLLGYEAYALETDGIPKDPRLASTLAARARQLKREDFQYDRVVQHAIQVSNETLSKPKRRFA
jgi:hypothetical protein